MNRSFIFGYYTWANATEPSQSIKLYIRDIEEPSFSFSHGRVFEHNAEFRTRDSVLGPTSICISGRENRVTPSQRPDSLSLMILPMKGRAVSRKTLLVLHARVMLYPGLSLSIIQTKPRSSHNPERYVNCLDRLHLVEQSRSAVWFLS